jgi:hypothetical protein
MKTNPDFTRRREDAKGKLGTKEELFELVVHAVETPSVSEIIGALSVSAGWWDVPNW